MLVRACERFSSELGEGYRVGGLPHRLRVPRDKSGKRAGEFRLPCAAAQPGGAKLCRAALATPHSRRDLSDVGARFVAFSFERQEGAPGGTSLEPRPHWARAFFPHRLLIRMLPFERRALRSP
ncbi:hypothetical protein MRX96_013291 [Rhipicephalus microplus]